MDERAIREKKAHESSSLKRTSYQSFLHHTKFYYSKYISNIARSIMSAAEGKNILEIGAYAWYDWIYKGNTKPEKIVCINISKNAIRGATRKNEDIRMNIDFKLMDANNLEFEDDSFDMVYGAQILHHLNFSQSISEIYRVLKTDGEILFREPLGINPIAKMVRFLTPRARTTDEKPLEFEEFSVINNYFHSTYYYEQLLSVPFGILSRFLFKEPVNILTKTAFELDRLIEKQFPMICPLYRHVVIHGKKRTVLNH